MGRTQRRKRKKIRVETEFVKMAKLAAKDAVLRGVDEQSIKKAINHILFDFYNNDVRNASFVIQTLGLDMTPRAVIERIRRIRAKQAERKTLRQKLDGSGIVTFPELEDIIDLYSICEKHRHKYIREKIDYKKEKIVPVMKDSFNHAKVKTLRENILRAAHPADDKRTLFLYYVKHAVSSSWFNVLDLKYGMENIRAVIKQSKNKFELIKNVSGKYYGTYLTVIDRYREAKKFLRANVNLEPKNFVLRELYRQYRAAKKNFELAVARRLEKLKQRKGEEVCRQLQPQN